MKKKIIMISVITLLLLCLIVGAVLLWPKEPEKDDGKKIPVSVPAVDEKKKEMETVDYEALISPEILQINGTVHYGIRVYGEDEYSFSTPEQAVVSASVIKLFIMEYAFSQVTSGELTLDSQFEGNSLSTLLERMITVSDNRATNILIKAFSMETLNAYFKEQGYKNTRLERMMEDTASRAAGKENYTSVQDVMLFLDRLYQNRNQTPYKDMLAIMKQQQVGTKIRKDLTPVVEIANKTGELNDVEMTLASCLPTKETSRWYFWFKMCRIPRMQEIVLPQLPVFCMRK